MFGFRSPSQSHRFHACIYSVAAAPPPLDLPRNGRLTPSIACCYCGDLCCRASTHTARSGADSERGNRTTVQGTPDRVNTILNLPR